jgi:hypothetical protein
MLFAGTNACCRYGQLLHPSLPRNELSLHLSLSGKKNNNKNQRTDGKKKAVLASAVSSSFLGMVAKKEGYRFEVRLKSELLMILRASFTV